MAKDQKGHGSEKHAAAAAKSQGYLKEAARHEKAGDRRAAADARVKAREHAEEAHYYASAGKVKSGSASVDSGPKYNAGSVDKAIDSAYRGKKPPTAKQRAVTHALLKGRG